VWVHVDVALDAFLPHVGPAVPRHPLPLALGTLILPETSLLALVRSETLAFGPGLEAESPSPSPPPPIYNCPCADVGGADTICR